MSKETIEFIYGNPNLTLKHIEILQSYFHVKWKFAKEDHMYYIDPESGKAMCQPDYIFRGNDKYQFKLINVKTIKAYVNRLQKQETNLARRDGQTTSGIQCTPSKVTITSGHLEYGKIDFRWGGKAKIGKANLSF
jgi:hypothetical protein